MHLSEEMIAFLPCRTPEAWIHQAVAQVELLLLDHAHCEKKAASTAINFLFRYPDKSEMTLPLSKLAREELRHFEKVLQLMRRRGMEFRHLPPSRYADGLRKQARTHEPARLTDILIIGAFIEARSCERFASLVPHLDEELSQFYARLVTAEARHYLLYLELAERYSAGPIDERIAFFREVERELICSTDEMFRFHSGVC